MSFPDHALPFQLILPYFLAIFSLFLHEFFDLFLEQSALILLLCVEVRPLGEFHLQRGVFLLVLLVLLKQRFKFFDLLVLLIKCGLDLGDPLSLFLYF